jgi:DNA-directed RNA polymerase subunit L
VQCKVIEKGKDVLEVELDDKTIANLVVSELSGAGVDAACYEPHPLFPAMRIKIKSKTAEKDLKSAVVSLEKKVSELKKTL